MSSSPDTVAGLLAEIADIGRDPARGGYSRPVFSSAEMTLREWSIGHASRRGLEVETDRNGIIWAWHAPAGRTGAVVTGSHLDSVPGGGAFDGPLGVASALVALDKIGGIAPGRPRAIAVFPEEEGSRFGVACLGSRLITGAITPERSRVSSQWPAATMNWCPIHHSCATSPEQRELGKPVSPSKSLN